VRDRRADPSFWCALDDLVATCELVIDRPKGSAHPRYPALIYPLDYGYLAGTTASDGGGIDVWVGSEPGRGIVGIVATVDLKKRDAELKILLGCTEEEIAQVLAVHNDRWQSGVLVRSD
jgi:inorganic pyrophosphatase